MITIIKFVRLSLFLATLLALGSCGGGSSGSGAGASTDPVAPAMRSLVAIGDSIGTGFGLATPWPTLLADILGAPVENNSVSREQTGFGLSIIEARLDAVNPTHVVILMGTNDAIRGSTGAAIANLQAMVDIARAKGVIAVVGTLPPITNSLSSNARAEVISMGIRGLSGANVVEVRGAFGNGSGLIADGIHPNQMGQMIIADTFAGAF